MKRRAAVRSGGVCACQRVDPLAAFESRVRPQPFGDDNAALNAVEILCVDNDLAAHIANLNPAAVFNSKFRRVLRMDFQLRPALFGN